MRTNKVRPSVLVTEDEALISLDLCGVLQDAGYHVVGPANTLQSALFLLEQQQPQAAIVDLMLRDDSSSLLLHQLHRRGIPFLVHSGYAREDDLLAMCHGAPWITKPAAPGDLIATLQKLLRQTVSA